MDSNVWIDYDKLLEVDKKCCESKAMGPMKINFH